MRGGDAVSANTLTIWYIAHIALLPIGLALLAGLFLYQVRRSGVRLVIPTTAAAVVLGVLLIAAVLVPAPLGPAAEPADYSSFASPPEWYVLPMHGLLNLAQRLGPKLGFLGSMVLPGLAVLWLLVLPWSDRRTIDQPPSRAVAGTAAMGVAAVLALTFWNAGHMAPLFVAIERPIQTSVMVSAAADTPLDPALIEKGKQLYTANQCAACHKIAGEGGAVGPPLDNTGRSHPDINWHIEHP
jgi:quinol-cytochrome oxidoreductase complex cytochrome b subunit